MLKLCIKYVWFLTFLNYCQTQIPHVTVIQYYSVDSIDWRLVLVIS